MPSYTVIWEQPQLYAPTPREAAELARQIQQDPDNFSTFYTVVDEESGESIGVELEEFEEISQELGYDETHSYTRHVEGN
jgi:hypothetical protein